MSSGERKFTHRDRFTRDVANELDQLFRQRHTMSEVENLVRQAIDYGQDTVRLGSAPAEPASASVPREITCPHCGMPFEIDEPAPQEPRPDKRISEGYFGPAGMILPAVAATTAHEAGATADPLPDPADVLARAEDYIARRCTGHTRAVTKVLLEDLCALIRAQAEESAAARERKE